MEILMVFLLIIVMTVFMAAGFLGISFALGVYLNSREGARASPADSDPCAQCDADREWYDALSSWQKNAVTAWWWVNRLAWALKGCK